MVMVVGVGLLMGSVDVRVVNVGMGDMKRSV